MERAFVIAAQGDRHKNVERLVKNIRSYSILPIHILTTEDSPLLKFPVELKEFDVFFEIVEPVWTEGPRAAIRNSNYWKVNFALEHHYNSLCMLDDDMYIVDPNFIDGFTIAEKFGVAIPANPRTYNCFNMMGADVRNEDINEIALMKIPPSIPAVNFSPFFVYPHAGYASNFLRTLTYELKNVPCRGTVAIVKAMWNSQFTPVILPEQWCVCGSNAQHIKDYTKILRGQAVNINPIMLHLGHDEVRKVFADIIEEN